MLIPVVSRMHRFVCCVVLLGCVVLASSEEGERQERSIGNLINQVISRASSTSEVLTLNLTNLIIILVIKAVLIGLGIFGFGGLGAAAAGRSATTNYMEDRDVIWGLTYILSRSIDNYDCLNKLACQDPQGAKNYLFASKMMLKGAKMTKGFLGTYDPQYEHIVYGIQEAMDYQGRCDEVFPTCAYDL